MVTRALLKLFLLLALLLGVGWAWLSGSYLEKSINWMLPQGWSVSLPKGLKSSWQGLGVGEFSLAYQDCTLFKTQDFSLTWQASNQVLVEQASLDYACLEKLPQSEEKSSSSSSLTGLLALIPYGQVQVKSLEWTNLPDDLNPRLSGLLGSPAQMNLAYTPEKLRARLEQKQLKLEAELVDFDLNLSARYQVEEEDHQLTLFAKIADDLTRLPSQLSLNYDWHLPEDSQGKDLSQGTAQLDWQEQAGQKVGKFAYQSKINEKNQLTLPLVLDENSLNIEQGQFYWDWLESFPLQGFVRAKLTPKALDFKDFFPLQTYIRVSLLSQGERGKGNLVIENKDGVWQKDSLALPLRLTGEVKYGNSILYSAVPLDLQGNFDDLTLRFLPSSLIRVSGKERFLTINDLRFPLAGIRVNKHGISGRLQALFKGESPDFKEIALHLDGYANNFKAGQLDFFSDPADPEAVRDQWNWRFWGGSNLGWQNLPLKVSGRGHWHEKLVQLSEFQGDLGRIKQPLFELAPMKLVLSEPIDLAYEHAYLTGGLRLTSPLLGFAYGGELKELEARLNFQGESDNLNLKGEVEAAGIAPMRLFARRQLTEQASHLNGRMYWNEQPIKAFQSLIPVRQNMVINQGRLKGETAFSYNALQGFVAGGHFSVKDGALSLPNGEITGAEFALPYQFKQGEFDFGVKKPLDVKIRSVNIGLPMTNVRVKVNGHYPYSRKKPLTLSQLSFNLLGGQLAVNRFALPQTKVASLELTNIDLAEIFDTVQYQQIQMKGRVNASLPFWLEGKPCYVCGGKLAQVAPSYLKFSEEFVKAMGQGGYTERILLELVNGSQLNDFKADVNVDEEGNMDLAAQIKTELLDRENGKVNLNYTHKENLFDLWFLVKAGDYAEDQIQHKLYKRLEK
ncbi:hypothetical protein A4G20_04360 [Pasteurellaceae bacterium RH1A]|nr:hypothetical protein A4G20_04360 [Pasteurellaceae bacterium RH1A]